MYMYIGVIYFIWNMLSKLSFLVHIHKVVKFENIPYLCFSISQIFNRIYISLLLLNKSNAFSLRKEQ